MLDFGCEVVASIQAVLEDSDTIAAISAQLTVMAMAAGLDPSVIFGNASISPDGLLSQFAAAFENAVGGRCDSSPGFAPLDLEPAAFDGDDEEVQQDALFPVNIPSNDFPLSFGDNDEGVRFNLAQDSGKMVFLQDA